MSADTNVVDFIPSDINAEETSLGKLQNIASQNESSGKRSKPEIALALGGGAARGWAHIGVLRAIDEAEIPVSMIAGTSIGALVGGCYLAGKLDELEEFARSITRRNILRYMDFAFRASGLLSGTRLADKMDAEIGHLKVEDLDRRFIAIATDICNGSEVWIENGLLSDAIRSSYALPGVFKPVNHFNRQLVDGALVNPVPVSACRAFEERIVLAVNLSSEVFGRSSVVRSTSFENNCEFSEIQTPEETANWFPFAGKLQENNSQSRLGIAGVMIEAFNIIQDRIIRSRLAGDPPDITIRPNLSGIALSDFHKADEAIEIGYQMARLKLVSLEETILASASA
ncbi:MAG: patatin-like phospholipase family protein [Pseudomonadota bacterium]